MKRFLVIPLSLALLWSAACGPDDESPPKPKTDTVADTDTVVDPDVTDPDVGPDVPPVELAISYHFVIEGGTKGDGEDSATLYLEDEPLSYAGLDGLQVDIAATATGLTTGRPVELIINGNAYGQPIQAAVIDGVANINFSGVTMPPSGNEGYEVVVQSTTTDGTAVSASKTVLVHTDQCPVFVSPTTEDGCLITDIDDVTPGMQVGFQVTHVGGQCNRARLTYAIDDGEATIMDDVLFDENGSASFVVPVTASEGPHVGTVNLTVEAIHPSSPALNGSLADLAYTVDTDVPVVTITQPDPSVFDTINLTMDKDPSPEAIGIQFDVLGTVTGLSDTDLNSLSLSIDNGPSIATTTPQSGVFAFQDVTFTQNSDSVVIKVTGTDACTNAHQASADMKIYSGLSQLTIDSPTTGSTLFSKDNGAGGSETAYAVDFGLTASALIAGNKLLVECRALNGGNTYFEVGSMTMTAENIANDDIYTLPVLLDTSVVSNNALCRARVEAENPNQSADIALVIGLPAPSISLSSPVDGVKLNALSITLVGQASNLEGESLDITVVDGAAMLADCTFQDGNVAGGVFSFTSDLATNCPEMVGGSYTISVGATDSYGNTTADNGGDASVLALFDVTAPTLTLVTPALDVLLDPVNNAEDADQDPDTPGYQITVSAQMNGEVDANGAQICLSVAGVDQGCQAVNVADWTVTWPGVTLQPGVSAVVLSGQDAYGNAADALNTTIDLDYDAPIVNIITPAADLVTTADALDFVVEVKDSKSDLPVGDATVALLQNGTPEAGEPTIDAAAGTYTFTGVSINQASIATPFIATADTQGFQGASAARIVTKKVASPTIAVDNITQGKFFNLASNECAGIQADCVLTVTAALTDAEPGSTAELDVTCDGDAEATNYQDVIGDLTATFDQVTLKHGGACSLVASVTDLAQQKTTADAIQVSVDRVAPTIGEFAEPEGTVLVALDDQKPGEEGMQHALQLEVSGLEVGTIVSVLVEWTDEDLGAQSQNYQYTMTEAVADDATKVVAYEDVVSSGYITYPEGTVTLTAVASDAALNPTQLIKQIVVQSNPPEVKMSGYAYLGETVCAASADCGNSATCYESSCWHGVGILSPSDVTLFVGGLVTTQDNVRVCTDHAAAVAAADATPCATEGYVVSTTASAATSGALIIPLSLNAGYQTIIGEVQDQIGAPWTSSVSQADEGLRSRRIYWDKTAPSVTSLSSSSDTIPPTSAVLCAAEWVSDGGPAEGDGGNYFIDFQGDAEGTYEILVQGQVRASGVVAADTPVQATVQLDEGGNEVYVKLTDEAGNLSVLPPDNTVIYYQPTVDTVVPDVYFSNPDSGTVLAGDNLNVILYCDENGSSVTLYDLQSATPAVPIDTLLVTNEYAIFDDATYQVLTDGQHELQAQVTDPSGNNTSLQSGVIQVDVTAPTVTIDSPASGLEIVDDASAGTPGFQVSVDFSTQEDAATYEIKITSGCDAAYAGCGAPVEVASGNITNAGGAEPTQDVTIPITEALSYKQLTVEVSDALGNVATDMVNLSFNIGDCAVAITNLPDGDWFNTTYCPGQTSCASAQVDLDVTFFGCGAVDDVQLTGIAVDNEVEDLGNGSATYTVTLTDGADLDLEVKAFVAAAEAGSSGVQSRGVDLTAPEVAFVSTTVGNFQTPTEGDSAVYNASDDTGGNAGFQGHLALTITDTNATDGWITAITGDSGGGATPLTLNDGNTLPHAYGGASGSTETFAVGYPEGSTTVVATAADAAGNVDTATFDVTIDTVAPAALIVASTGGVLDSGSVDPRLPAVSLSFDAVGDDDTGAGAASSYVVRYSNEGPISTEETWDEACDASALAHTSLPAPAAPGTPESVSIQGPDARSSDTTNGQGQLCTFMPLDSGGSWYFAIRAQDDAGNLSPITGTSGASTPDIVHRLAHIEFTADFQTNTGVSPTYLTLGMSALGDVNGDTVGDFATFFKGMGFCVFYGGDFGSSYQVSGATGAMHDCLFDAAVGTGDADGKDLGNLLKPLGDINGDGVDDFVAMAKIGGFGFGGVYLGETGGPDLTTPNIRITNIEATNQAYTGICGAGNFDGDASGLADIAVGEEAADRVRVLAGNDTWVASGGTETFLTINVGDAGDQAAHVLLNIVATPANTYQMGRKCESGGDVLASPGGGGAADDLVVELGGTIDSSIAVIPGRTGLTGETVTITDIETTPAGATSEDATTVRLRQEPGSVGGWGASFQAGQDLTGDGVPDVFVVHSGRAWSKPGADGKSLYIFDGALLANGAGAAAHRVSSGATQVGDAFPGTNGTVIYADPHGFIGGTRAVGDWDGWLVGGNPTSDIVQGLSSLQGLVIRANQQVGGASINLGMFPYGQSEQANPNNPTAPYGYGAAVDGGADLTGDGLVDFVVATAAGELYVYY